MKTCDFCGRQEADEAQTLWRESLRLNGSYSVPHYMLARLAIERAASASSGGDAAAAQENYVVAEEELRAAVALRPRDAEYLYGLGQVQYLLGRGEPARQALRLALEINPDIPPPRRAQCRVGPAAAWWCRGDLLDHQGPAGVLLPGGVDAAQAGGGARDDVGAEQRATGTFRTTRCGVPDRIQSSSRARWFALAPDQRHQTSGTGEPSRTPDHAARREDAVGASR